MKTIYRFLTVLFAFPFFAALTTCTQEPLFYYIHLEYPPIEPIIGGAPTEIVKAGNVLYVANQKSLWEYDMSVLNPRWVERSKPSSEFIKAVAATTTDLYVLDVGGSIYKLNGTNWDPLGHISGAEQIYGADDRLFIGTKSTVYDETLSSITGVKGLLRGAIGDNLSGYYICMAEAWASDPDEPENTGIFTVPGLGVAATKVYPPSGNVSVKGIINAGTTIVAVTENTIVYQDSIGGFDDDPISPGVSFTGGMALWEHGTEKKILLGLKKGSGTFAYGYRELDLDGSGDVITKVYEPGNVTDGRTTSIDPGSRETSAIGKHPVTALYAIPSSPALNSGDSDGRPIIVASTQQNGVWSYRVRQGTPQWNGEDNSN
jgi:hypothetical protein